MKNILVKAGTYYLGDPSYCFEDEWELLSEIADNYYDFSNNIMKIKDREIYVFNSNSKGSSFDNYGEEYPSETGLICLIPIELCKSHNKIISLDKDTLITYDCGILSLGNIVVNTNFYSYEEDHPEEDGDDY